MQTHDYRIDRLRLLACFGVVMLHSSAGSGADDLVLNALFRFSVPVFVIISGWFQLSGPVSGAHLAKKSAGLFVRLLLCSLCYLLYNRVVKGTFPREPAAYLLTGPVHLWYLYATMGLYLLTPALYPFVRSAEQAEYRYALALCFGIGCGAMTLVRLEWFPILAEILDESKLPDMLGFVYLYLLGGYFRKFGFRNPRYWMTAGILSALISVFASQMPYNQQLLSFIAPNVVLAGGACFVFYMTRRPLPERFDPLLRRASGCTMGVYLLHLMVSDFLTPHLRPVMEPLFPSGAMAVRGVCVFTVTFVAVLLLRCIRPVRKYVL